MCHIALVLPITYRHLFENYFQHFNTKKLSNEDEILNKRPVVQTVLYVDNI